MGRVIVGLSGKAGAGKDTIADILVAKYGFEKTAFAYGVKRACGAVFKFSDEQLFGDQKSKNDIDPRWGYSPRQAMQAMGDALRSALDPDVWVKSLAQRLESEYAPHRRIVVCDVRYPNELNWLASQTAVLIRVERPTSLSGQTAAHPSEIALDIFSDWDYIIRNDSSVGKLSTAVDEIATKQNW